jgi:D-alanine-D-alanine ligase
MKIAVLANLKKDVPLIKEHPPDDEYWDDLDDVSTLKAIRSALRAGGHHAKYIVPNVNLIRHLLNYKPDLCFNLCEGHFGASREAQVPAILDMLRLPYTGSGVLGMSLAHNKFIAKKVFRREGVPTAPFFLVENPRALPDFNIPFPLFVKPAHEGTSIGINENSVVYDREALIRQIDYVWEKVHAPALVEQYIAGREFTVSILGDEVLPIIEIITPTGYYSNRLKEVDPTGVVRVCPADIPRRKLEQVQRIARAAMQHLELVDISRIDMRMDADGNLFVLEVNPLPLLLPNPREASFVASSLAAGYSYIEMVNRIVTISAQRLGLQVEPETHSRPLQPKLADKHISS